MYRPIFLPSVRLRQTSTFRLFFAAIRSPPRPGSSPKVEQKGMETALRVLDLIATKPINGAGRGGGLGGGGDSSHARLIQGCMADLLKPQGRRPNSARIATGTVGEQIQVSSDGKDDPFALFQELHRRGFSTDPTLVSGVLSSRGAVGDLGIGMQLHSMSVKTNINDSSAVVSSLISLYSKCGHLGSAYQVFEEMHLRSTVLYTSMIAAFAQHCWIEDCFNLFIDMMQSGFDPNDFTFTSVLSACTDTGCLGVGRCVHSLVVQMGFVLYPYVCNALISMYAKCGSIDKSTYIFENMDTRDLIAWNSMISGYAQYGLAEKALSLLNKMTQQKISPDAVTFLGVLSSCRHAGLVEQGRRCFDSMLEHGLQPNLDHYSCIIDLLGRAGLLEEAFSLIISMPARPNAIIWGSLLSSCKVYGNIKMGILAAQSRLLLEPECAATHVQLANLYAAMGCWDDFAMVRKLMKERGLKTTPGYSWIEVGGEIYTFRAEGRLNSESNESITILEILDDHMKNL